MVTVTVTGAVVVLLISLVYGSGSNAAVDCKSALLSNKTLDIESSHGWYILTPTDVNASAADDIFKECWKRCCSDAST